MPNVASFIVPAQPMRRVAPPRGQEWLHEVKFDGWRVQLHKHEDATAIYSRKGFDLTRWLPTIALALNGLHARSVIIDGELVALDDKGLPDFEALHFRRAHAPLCIFAFDVLHLNGCA